MIIRNEKDSITNGIIGGSSEGVAKFYKLGSEFESNTAFAIGGTTNAFIENGKKYRCNTFRSPDNIVFPKAGKVECLVVGGGGAGGFGNSDTRVGDGGGGAGGYRTATVVGKSTSLTVGAGGGYNNQLDLSYPGGSSSFLGIVSSGGGRGGQGNFAAGSPGGSGGGGNWTNGGGGSGNDPPVSPPQGNPGGFAHPNGGGGGGGAGGSGNPGQSSNGAGGAGITSSFTGTSITRARGGNRNGLANSPSDSGNGGRGRSPAGGSPGEVSIRYRVT